MGEHGVLKPGQWPVLDLTESDWADVRTLFSQVFGTELTPGLQAWKYGAGRGVCMGVRDGTGTLVAHYGGGYRPLSTNGQVCTAIQMQDVMVSPSARDVLARFGPFGRLTRAFIETRVGEQLGVPFGFGFPSGRHLKLGNRLGMYQALEPVWAWRWQVADVPEPPAGEVGLQVFDWGSATELEMLGTLAQRHAALHADCLMPVRDVAWWRHRYANHPQHVYAVRWLVQPGAAEPLAAVVLRQFGPGQDWELMDWMVATPKAGAVLLPALRPWLAHADVPGVQLWASQATVADWPVAVLAAASRTQACNMAVTHAMVLARPSTQWAGQVWVTGGDTDFR
jgi:hypothetical protein